MSSFPDPAAAQRKRKRKDGSLPFTPRKEAKKEDGDAKAAKKKPAAKKKATAPTSKVKEADGEQCKKLTSQSFKLKPAPLDRSKESQAAEVAASSSATWPEPPLLQRQWFDHFLSAAGVKTSEPLPKQISIEAAQREKWRTETKFTQHDALLGVPLQGIDTATLRQVLAAANKLFRPTYKAPPTQFYRLSTEELTAVGKFWLEASGGDKKKSVVRWPSLGLSMSCDRMSYHSPASSKKHCARFAFLMFKPNAPETRALVLDGCKRQAVFFPPLPFSTEHVHILRMLRYIVRPMDYRLRDNDDTERMITPILNAIEAKKTEYQPCGGLAKTLSGSGSLLSLYGTA